jgi:NADP-dependent 3-hydroxy acid dehydrogenase YdfG
VTGEHVDVAGPRLLVVGASSGIGHAVATNATERGAKVAVAARRMDLLTELAKTVGGSAFELDVEDTDLTTWLHAFNANAVGANNVLRAALPHLSENGVVLVASSNDVGRPRAGVAAYGASKAALDEILVS